MKRNKLLVLLVLCAFMVSLLAGCKPAVEQNAGTATPAAPEAKEVKITVMNSKGEIQAPMEEAAKVFETENPGIKVEIVPCPVGTSPFEKLSSLYAAGTAPTISILDGGDVPKFVDKAADLSNEKWVADALFLDSCKNNGKVVSFPVTVEGCAFIYNKAVLDKASVDPAAIKTTKDLEEAFKKVEAINIAPLVIGPMDWSLGAHFLPVAFAAQAKDQAGVVKYIDDVKAGTVDVSKDKIFNGLLDTFDVMKKYNYAKKDALGAVDYNKCAELIAKGEVAFYFQGNWTWPAMESFDTAGGAYGYLPVPISNNADDFGNTQMQAGVSKFAIMDKEQNSEEQQAAAKKFLEWVVYSQTGQEALMLKSKIIMAFKNVSIEPVDPLSKSIVSYMKSGNTLTFAGSVLPPDHWPKVGPSMQKYLAGKSDRATLFSEITDYWKSVK